MEPSTVVPRPAKPPRWWVLVTLAAGAAGAAGAIAAGGVGTYDVTPFRVELRARPAALGKTELAVRPLPAVQPGHAEAGTHRAPIAFRATVTGLAADAVARSDREALTNPHDLAGFIAEEGKGAMRSFGIRLAILAFTGGAAAGLAISFRRWRRIVGAALAGLLTLAVVGLLVQQTYDRDEFLKTQFVPEPAPLPTGVLSR